MTDQRGSATDPLDRVDEDPPGTVARSALVIHSGSTIRGVEPGGSSPLAPIKRAWFRVETRSLWGGGERAPL